MAERLLGLRVRIPPAAWILKSNVWCQMRGLCDGPITRPEESHQLWCVSVCDLETSRMRRPWPELGCCVRERKKKGNGGIVNVPEGGTYSNHRVLKRQLLSGVTPSRFIWVRNSGLSHYGKNTA